MSVVADGEYRRSFQHCNFMSALTGPTLVERGKGGKFQGATLRPNYPTISSRLDFPLSRSTLEHFQYLVSVSDTWLKAFNARAQRLPFLVCQVQHSTSRIRGRVLRGLRPRVI